MQNSYASLCLILAGVRLHLDTKQVINESCSSSTRPRLHHSFFLQQQIHCSNSMYVFSLLCGARKLHSKRTDDLSPSDRKERQSKRAVWIRSAGFIPLSLIRSYSGPCVAVLLNCALPSCLSLPPSSLPPLSHSRSYQSQWRLNVAPISQSTSQCFYGPFPLIIIPLSASYACHSYRFAMGYF